MTALFALARTATAAAAGALFLSFIACGSEDAPRQGATGGQRTLMLSESDVAMVTVGSIEEGVAITGVLRPNQTIAVRARLEGDIEAVFVREGESVRGGQVLARFEAAEQVSGRESARAERIAAEGELATAQWNLEQTQELYRAGAVAERDLRAAQQSVTTARARLAAARTREQTTGTTVRDTRVLAPTDAVVSSRLVEPGERVARGAELFTLVRSEMLELTAAVPERMAATVATGQLVRFQAAGRTFEGRVARVSPTIDPTTRAITVYVQIPNPDGALRGGTFASGVVIARTVDRATVVPIPAVRQTVERTDFVYRIAGTEVEQIPVTLGVVSSTTGIAEVTSGLSPGDRVIVGNVGAVGRGMRVQILGGDRPASAGAQSPAGAAPRPAAGATTK